jgi:hypothetical protein
MQIVTSEIESRRRRQRLNAGVLPCSLPLGFRPDLDVERFRFPAEHRLARQVSRDGSLASKITLMTPAKSFDHCSTLYGRSDMMASRLDSHENASR